ncbi:hypothetical protein G7Y89_g7332 [Cudoniella acicularis]|uniref:Uncharacterized protein n=1 Tax=Cudoniella acicularis TaxID=354080 RepID=A0A8H4RL12_9HELO|nr:hypothetical protein G7Y89_g7332 [Cudoniella acicularis]
MQSFLQYRRFRRYAQDQYERDKKQAEALEQGMPRMDLETTPLPEEKEIEKHSDIDLLPLTTNLRMPQSHPTRPGLPTLMILKRTVTTQSLGVRMGYALSGIEVRQLSAQMTRTRTRRASRLNTRTKTKTNTNEKEKERPSS